MKVLVDTCVWSLALRRKRKDLSRFERAIVLSLRDMIGRGQTIIPGVVRQELLSGTPDLDAFEALRVYLREFPDEAPTLDDYEDAARCDNVCRSLGLATSPVDMVVCALARRYAAPVLTTDEDFNRYARHLSFQLFVVTA